MSVTARRLVSGRSRLPRSRLDVLAGRWSVDWDMLSSGWVKNYQWRYLNSWIFFLVDVYMNNLVMAGQTDGFNDIFISITDTQRCSFIEISGWILDLQRLDHFGYSSVGLSGLASWHRCSKLLMCWPCGMDLSNQRNRDFTISPSNKNYGYTGIQRVYLIIYIYIGSMVLVYMVTWIPSIYPLYVSIYTSTMDPVYI